MCLVVLAHEVHKALPLVVLANRDEFYARPSAPADYWPDIPGLLAGRDLVAGGTWMGIRGNRWAAVTNVRETMSYQNYNKSRGWLVRDYLLGKLSPETYLKQVCDPTEAFSGFNLLLGDKGVLWYGSNRGGTIKSLAPGFYALSNHQLDAPWPKVQQSKQLLADYLGKHSPNPDEALTLLNDIQPAPDYSLPSTGIPLNWERTLSAMFIISESYGTRSTTLLMRFANGEQRFIERRYDRTPDVWDQSDYTLSDNRTKNDT